MSNRPKISPTTVRQLLNRWESTVTLAQHPLAELVAVEQLLTKSHGTETIVGRGLAVKELLNSVIQTLKPNDQKPQPLKREWRRYIIITERYCHGRLPEWIMVQLSISSRTFYRELKDGLQEIAATIQHLESQAKKVGRKSTNPRLSPKPASPHIDRFLAPPLPDHPFVGHEHERTLGLLRYTLTVEHKRHVALHGIPGVGKTTLAAALTHVREINLFFPDGIIWISVGQTPDLIGLFNRLAAHFNIDLDGLSADEAITYLQQNCVTKKCLFILDDVWDSEIAQKLSIGGGKSAHLITTRQIDTALTVAGSATFALTELNRQDSEQLLVKLAPEIASQPAIDLALLHQQTGGLPLALVIFGKYLLRHGYRGQMSRLAAAIDELNNRQNRLNLTDNQINLAATIKVSVSALPQHAAKALADLTLYPPKPNSFSLEFALPLCGNSTETFYQLVDSGLVEVVESDRFGLHRSVHDYAAGEQRESIELSHSLESAADFCERASGRYQIFDLEQQNIEALIKAKGAKRVADTQSRILLEYIPYLLDRGRLVTAEEMIKEPLKRAKSRKAAEAEARLTLCASLIVKQKDGATKANRLFKKGIALAEQAALTILAIRWRVTWVESLIRQGRPADALTQANLIRPNLDQLADPKNKAALNVRLSYIYYFHGDYRSAFDLVSAARHLFEQVQSESSEELSHLLADVYKKLGVIAVELGQFSSSSLYYDKAYERFQLLGNRGQEAHLLNNMGVLALKKGRWLRATELHKKALEVRQELDDIEGQGQSYVNLAVTAVSQRDVERAKFYIGRGLDLSRSQGMRYREGLFKLLEAWLWRVRNDFAEALKSANEAYSLAVELDREQTAGEAAIEQGYALTQLNRLDEAFERLIFAHDIWMENRQSHLLATTQIYLANVQMRQNKRPEAESNLAAGLDYIDQTLDGLDDMMDIFQITIRLLEQLGDESKAAVYKQKAISYLRQQSLQIEDESVRAFFIKM